MYGTIFHQSARRGQDPAAGHRWLHFSEGAIQEAIFFGQACRARVIVLHVVNTQAESISAANFAVRQGWEELAPHFEHIRTMAKDSGVEIEEVVVGSSKPERTIVEQARLREADVILMGRRGKSGRLGRAGGQDDCQGDRTGLSPGAGGPKDFIITGPGFCWPSTIRPTVGGRRKKR
jgi:nucleotide-binding universal stress UspA family protein